MTLPPDPGPQTPETTRTPGWMRIVLIVSLAANLLIVGIVAGSVLGRDTGGDRNGDQRDARFAGPAPLIRAFEPEDRQALGRAMREGNPPRIRDTQARIEMQFEAFLVALRAEPFDAEAVRMLLEDQRNSARERMEFGQSVLVDHLASMSAEDRRAYADRLDKSLRRDKR